MATVSENGWPYVQLRGGKPSFLRVVSPTQLAFAGYNGKRKAVTPPGCRAALKQPHRTVQITGGEAETYYAPETAIKVNHTQSGWLVVPKSGL